MTVLLSLFIALMFGAIFLLGGRAIQRTGITAGGRFLSFAAGISIGYVFVHVLPALAKMTDMAESLPSDIPRLTPEYSVYLWTLAGFLVFYGLEAMAPAGHSEHEGHEAARSSARAWVHIGGFAVYAWMLTYLMVWNSHHTLALCLYGVAMGMHIFPIACHLKSHYKPVYEYRGAIVLAAACLAGWATGLAPAIPTQILVNIVAFVAGGVVVNSAIGELPEERHRRTSYFVSGAIVYSALLLVLSHFEHGGEIAH